MMLHVLANHKPEFIEINKLIIFNLNNIKLCDAKYTRCLHNISLFMTQTFEESIV